MGDPCPRLRSSDGLDGLDAGLATLATFDEGLQHIDGVEDGPFIRRASDHDRVLQWRIDGEIDLRLTEVGGDGRTAGERKT